MHDDHLTLRIDESELDMATVDAVFLRLRDEIDATGSSDVAIDMLAVRFIDSTAIGEFVRLRSQLVEQDGSLSLLSANARIRRTLTITGLDAAFNLPPS